MNLKRTFLGLIIASSVGAVAVPAAADIIVRIGPPPDRYEAAPAPRHGHVWEPGYWNWNGNRYAWRSGHWERQRHGYVHVPPRWVEREGRWHFEAHRWDRDGDGMANRRDRDGDGVPDHRDRRPDNPNRS